MGDDREIADIFNGRRSHAAQITLALRSGKPPAPPPKQDTNALKERFAGAAPHR